MKNLNNSLSIKLFDKLKIKKIKIVAPMLHLIKTKGAEFSSNS
jgi:hypothetical protein